MKHICYHRDAESHLFQGSHITPIGFHMTVLRTYSQSSLTSHLRVMGQQGDWETLSSSILGGERFFHLTV